MINVRISQGRLGILIGIVAMFMLASIPLIGNAQDAASTMTEQELIEEGEKTYSNVCIACHQPDGKGIESIYLPLNGNPLVTGDNPTHLITTVLNGRGGMPRFDITFSDEEIAAVTTYVRQNWENDAPMVSPEEVAEIRAQIEMTTPTPDAQIPQGLASGTPVTGGEATPAPKP